MALEAYAVHNCLSSSKHSIRSAKSIERKLRIRTITINHPRFIGVHDAAHTNVKRGASQQAHAIFATQKKTGQKSANIQSGLEQQENQMSGAQQFGSREEQSADVHGKAGLDGNTVETTADFSLDNYEGALEQQPVLLMTHCKSLQDAVHQERAAPSSTDKRLATELASARHGTGPQTASRGTHRCRITAEDTMLEARRAEREARKVSSESECLVGDLPRRIPQQRKPLLNSSSVKTAQVDHTRTLQFSTSAQRTYTTRVTSTVHDIMHEN